MIDRSRWALTTATLWNLLAQALPSLAAVASIPILLANLGPAAFGFLALAYVLVGYFSILDFGISRSLTRSVAQRIGRGEITESREVATLGLLLLLALSLPMALAAYLATPIWLGQFGQQDQALLVGSASIALAIAASIPAIMIFQAQRGIVEAAGEFRTSSIVKTASGTLIYALPALASFHTNRLEVLLWAIVAARVTGILAYAVLASDTLRWRLPQSMKPGLRELMTFGAWITLSSLLSPVMIYADRFFIGHGSSLEQAGIYAVAFDVLTKLLVIPAAVAGAVYPMAAQQDHDAQQTAAIFLRGLLLVSIPLALILSALMPFSQPLLAWWIDANLAAALQTTVPILAIGVMLNALAHIPYAIVQAGGDARTPALLHAVELPFYVVALLYCLSHWGIAGAAAAWAARAGLDLALLTWLAGRRKGLRPAADNLRAFAAPVGAMLVTITACLVSL